MMKFWNWYTSQIRRTACEQCPLRIKQVHQRHRWLDKLLERGAVETSKLCNIWTPFWLVPHLAKQKKNILHWLPLGSSLQCLPFCCNQRQASAHTRVSNIWAMGKLYNHSCPTDFSANWSICRMSTLLKWPRQKQTTAIYWCSSLTKYDAMAYADNVENKWGWVVLHTRGNQKVQSQLCTNMTNVLFVDNWLHHTYWLQ